MGLVPSPLARNLPLLLSTCLLGSTLKQKHPAISMTNNALWHAMRMDCTLKISRRHMERIVQPQPRNRTIGLHAAAIVAALLFTHPTCIAFTPHCSGEIMVKMKLRLSIVKWGKNQVFWHREIHDQGQC